MFFQRGWKRGFVLWIDTNIFSQEQFALSEVTQARSVLAGLAQRLSEQSRAHQEHFQQAEQTYRCRLRSATAASAELALGIRGSQAGTFGDFLTIFSQKMTIWVFNDQPCECAVVGQC